MCVLQEKMKNKNIILFGDSIFCGVGASARSKGCGCSLRKEFSGKVLIKAKPGETSKDAIDRIKKDVLDQKDFEVVIILFGNNDCRIDKQHTPLVSPENFGLNLSKLINQIKGINTVPMLCNLQPIDSESFFRMYGRERYKGFEYSPYEWHEKYSKICDQVSKDTKTTLIDIRKALIKYEKDIIAQDGLHPNDKGHQIIKETLIEYLKGMR